MYCMTGWNMKEIEIQAYIHYYIHYAGEQEKLNEASGRNRLLLSRCKHTCPRITHYTLALFTRNDIFDVDTPLNNVGKVVVKGRP